MTYQWKKGFHNPNVSADVVGTVCQQLESAGNLNAASLVEVSKPVDVPLHSAFEWNDEVASQKWREHQARCIIHSIEVVPEAEDAREPIRAFFNIKSSENNYLSTQTIIHTPSLMEELLAQAKKELKAFKNKYNQIEALRGVIDEIDKLEAKEDVVNA